MHNKPSTPTLVKDLVLQWKTFLLEQFKLAKTEIEEKISKKLKDSAGIALGGMLAYAGLIVFLAGLGSLAAFAFQKLGLEPGLASFLGFAVLGLFVMAAGSLVAINALHALKKESLVPEKTVEKLQGLKGESAALKTPEPKKKDERTSEEIEADVIYAEARMKETLEELGDRVTLRRFRRQANVEVRNHPYRWGLIAMGAGVAASFLFKRNGNGD